MHIHPSHRIMKNNGTLLIYKNSFIRLAEKPIGEPANLYRGLCFMFLLAVAMVAMHPADAQAQLERQRAEQNRPVELVFPTSRHIQLPTTEPLSAGELYYSIMHAFGRMENGARDFWGLDQGANIRFSIEYGFTDRFSLFMARSSMDKVYEMGGRYHLIRQMAGSGSPVSVSLVAAGGIMTRESMILGGDFGFSDRLQLAVSLPVAHKVDDRISVLAVPSLGVVSKTDLFMGLDNLEDLEFAGLGLGARYKYSRRGSLTFQYMPSMGLSTGDTVHRYAAGLDLETGGHVFQLFFTTAPALNDIYLLSGRSGDLTPGHFRFGFNVNRSFQVR